ncbi:ubiquitin-activating enzyme [Plasmodium gonderi]|uniref:Ubiquitin-activating enzyme n=1 Tax=Plasmodium gonderi TaxID=77519 RepID=A0A1Y1JNH5_PLAGO|nr:ubiquitin-activating enzyme [Plasmodium gonderi]GAW81604.1 ubiquitin-activating enzyme [Plasmodium gonderi]
MAHFINKDFIKYGLCFLLGFYIKKIAKWGNREKKKMNEILDVICSKVETILYPFIFSLYDYKNVEKIEKELFYENFDKGTIDKYGKYININDIPSDSLEKIFKTKVLIIGLGGLGSPACFYLSKFGFKEIGLVDGDKVEKSNLQRQIIHMEKHIGMNKTLSAKLTVKNMGDDDANIKCYPFYLNKMKGLQIVKNYDIIVDCTDNISTRFLINDLCILYKKKLIFGSALGLYGQLNVFNMTEDTSNCYRCLKNFNNHTESNNCDENGILSTVTGVIGILQANEVIKLATNLDKQILQNFLTFNSLSSKRPFETLNMNHKNKNCICAWNNFDKMLHFILNNNYGAGVSDNNGDATESSINDGTENCIKYGTSDDAQNCSSNDICKGNKSPCPSSKVMNTYQYDIYIPDFMEILNNNFSFFQFPVNYLCILDIRKHNNTNVYGLKNSIKWSYYDIMESINDCANNSNKLNQLILEKLEITRQKGNIVIIVICRRGIDSLKIAKCFNNLFLVNPTKKNNTSTIPHLSSSNSILNFPTKLENHNKSEFQDKHIYTYNMKGGYLELQKKVFKNLPFL